MPSPPSSYFSSSYQPFLFLLFLFTFFISSLPFQLLNFLFLSTKSFCQSLISSPLSQSETLFLPQTLSSSPMAPKSKSKKTSYVISGDVFMLTHWNGATRLTDLLYLPTGHKIISRRCKCRIGEFFKSSSFSIFALIFHFNLFLDL